MKKIHLFFTNLIPLDKMLHFSVSFFITMVGFIISVPIGLFLSISAGFIKEISDKLYFYGWSWGDVFFNLLGVFSALFIYYLMGVM